MSEDLYLLWLSSIKDLSLHKKFKLMEAYGSAYNIWTAPLSSFKEIAGITPSNIEKIKASKNESELEKYIKDVKNKNIRFISIHNDSYPELLKSIYNPPYWLYIKGELPKSKLFVSIIGSRKCSSYGLAVANKIASDLAKENIVVISGMSEGIDSSAHSAVISSKGKTIAVFACGVDVCYPKFNSKLMDNIINNGCIVSEFPLGYRAYPNNFRQRNRIVSGLSHAVVVAEASYPSGTSVTVNFALEQGREVCAVPGNINSKNSVGTNLLIKQGAALVRSADDILDLFSFYEYSYLNIAPKKTNDHLENLATDEKRVYDCVSLEPIPVDGIVYKTNLSVSSVQFILTKLLLKHLILQLPGQGYVRSI